MSARPFATTLTEGLRSLGSSGQRSYELVSQTVLLQLGPDHARLFAEPEPAAQGDQTDWYTDCDGAVVPLADLAPEEQEAAKARLSALVSDIRRLAERLAASKDHAEQRLAEALGNALQIPGEEAVYVARPPGGGPPQPVLVDWAWVRDSRGAVLRDMLRGWAPKPPAAAVAAPPPPPVTMAPAAAAVLPVERTGAERVIPWLWLVVGLLIAWLLYLLLPACGLAGGFFVNHCPARVAAADTLDQDRSVIENGIARSERRLEQLGHSCRPAARADAGPEIEERLERENAAEGDLEVALVWNSRADADLHVICPDGAEISYRNRADCGGTLDVDANVSGNAAIDDPVEHVYFSAPVEGSYEVQVVLYRDEGGPELFTLQVRSGDHVETHEGTVTPSEKVWSMRFDYPT